MIPYHYCLKKISSSHQYMANITEMPVNQVLPIKVKILDRRIINFIISSSKPCLISPQSIASAGEVTISKVEEVFVTKKIGISKR